MLGVEDREDDPDEGPLDVSGGVDIEAIEDIVLKLYVCTVVYCCKSTYKLSKDEKKKISFPLLAHGHHGPQAVSA